jgi:hypothetical protein
MKTIKHNAPTLDFKEFIPFIRIVYADNHAAVCMTNGSKTPKAANDNRQPTKQPPCAAVMAA